MTAELENHPTGQRCPVCGNALVPRYEQLRDRLFDAPGSWALAECPACGTVALQPRPSAADLDAFYTRYFTHGDAASELPPQPPVGRLTASALADAGYQFEGSRSARWLTRVPAVRDLLLGQVYWLPTPPGRLLDVGCGDGRHLRLLRTLGWEVLGIDTDGAAAEVARKTFGLDVRTSTMRELPEAWFDAVVLHHVFEHVLDPDETLRDIRRVLRPGGRCIIVTPNGASLAQRLFGRSWVHWDPPRHLQVFVPTSLRTVLARHRFSRIDVRTTARNARFAWSASTGIRLSANERTGAGAPPLLRRISGLGFQVVESLALTVNGHLGEELVAVAYAD